VDKKFNLSRLTYRAPRRAPVRRPPTKPKTSPPTGRRCPPSPLPLGHVMVGWVSTVHRMAVHMAVETVLTRYALPC
jgi:hypothetical protein